jgi:hypothetical protein
VIFVRVEARRIDPAVAGKEAGINLRRDSETASQHCAVKGKLLTAEFAEKDRGGRGEYPFYV